MRVINSPQPQLLQDSNRNDKKGLFENNSKSILHDKCLSRYFFPLIWDISLA